MNKKEYKKRYELIKMKNGELETRYKSYFDKGQHILKDKLKIKKGKLSKAAGARFEIKVRNYWENNGWILDKWTNNVDLEKNSLMPAKRKFNPFKRIMSIGTGFPDFIAIKPRKSRFHEVIGIEVKMKGLLSKEEKEKCRWYLNKRIFSKILIAKKFSNGKKIGIEHIDFSKKWMK
ncbi:MAG: hypothetical protein QW727_02595 [Candidatus Pacearchaeota archaeon]